MKSAALRALPADVVAGLAAIKETIDTVSDYAASATAAISEQSNATHMISENIAAAAERLRQLWAS
jgi:hypothetical protein